MKKHLLYILTFTMMISLCCLASCGSNAEKISDEEISQLAQERFEKLRDTLTKQYDKECDSLFTTYVQGHMDSLIFKHLQSLDSTQTKN